MKDRKKKYKKKAVQPIREDTIKDIIRELVIEVAEDNDVDKDKVTDSAHFLNDLEMDSMSYVEIFASLESKFKISIPDIEMENMDTIDLCTEMVKRYIKKTK